MIITIDGPAGSGKSAAAVQLAQRLGIPHLDTGAMYRAIALDGLERKILHDPVALAQRAREMELRFDWNHRPAILYMDGRQVSDLVRQPKVTQVTYIAADNQEIRAELVRRQRLIGHEAGSLVTEGRDQGSIVFPDADYKFYLDAAPEERARRRIAQLATRSIHADMQEMLQQIKDRDTRDEERPFGGLRQTEDAIHVDTTRTSLADVVNEMYRIVTTRMPT